MAACVLALIVIIGWLFHVVVAAAKAVTGVWPVDCCPKLVKVERCLSNRINHNVASCVNVANTMRPQWANTRGMNAPMHKVWRAPTLRADLLVV